MSRLKALVTSRLLEWARISAGLTAEAVGAKLRPVAAGEVVTAWETGRLRPSMAQARQLAQIYRRPLGILYLTAPPAEGSPIPDLRSAPGVPVASPNLLWAVRRLRGLRESALELASDGRAFPPFPVTASQRESPDAVAARLRRALGVTQAEQQSWNSQEMTWEGWRAAAERVGCLVFLLDRIKSDNVSGLCVTGSRAPVIGINCALRSPGRRTRALLHGLVHVALRQGTVCGLEEVPIRVERFCNRVAGAILLPVGSLPDAFGRLGSTPNRPPTLTA